MARQLVVTAFAIVLSVSLLQLGLFDWPKFEETTIEPTLYFLVASTTTKDIGGNVERLLVGTKAAAEAVVSKEQLARPAADYGAPAGATTLSAGFFFDDPHAIENPRWGLGWAVDAKDDDEIQDILKKVSAKSTLSEPLRVVKIGGGMRVLRGRIPWRNKLTPAIAPMLHWRRAYGVYAKGGYTSDSGREGEEGSVACEVYVTGNNDSMEYIDYTVLMGDTREIFNGMFPQIRAKVVANTLIEAQGGIQHMDAPIVDTRDARDLDAIADTRSEPMEMDITEEKITFE